MHSWTVMQLVAIDEAHLYAQHGRSFREAMKILTTLFFAVVFKVGIWHPLFLAMTATMTLSLLPSISQLTNVEWTNNNHLLWSNCTEFCQRYIRLDFQVCDNMQRVAYPILINFMWDTPGWSAFVLVKFRGEFTTVATTIEELLIQTSSSPFPTFSFA